MLALKQIVNHKEVSEEKKGIQLDSKKEFSFLSKVKDFLFRPDLCSEEFSRLEERKSREAMIRSYEEMVGRIR